MFIHRLTSTLWQAPIPQRTVIFHRQTCFHFLWDAEHFALIREQKLNSKQQNTFVYMCFYICFVSNQIYYSLSCMRILLYQVVYKHGVKILPLLKEVIREEMAGCYRQMGKWVETTRQSCSAEEAALPAT